MNAYGGVLEDDMKQSLLINVTLLSHILSGGSLEDRSALAYFVCTALLHKCIDSCPDTRVNGLEQNLKIFNSNAIRNQSFLLIHNKDLMINITNLP